jgi:hypothetical protein
MQQLNFDPGVEKLNFRIEIFAKVRGGQKDELGKHREGKKGRGNSDKVI